MNTVSIPSNRKTRTMTTSFIEPLNLRNLLARMQSKIESRTRHPWFDLQRSYYFKNSKNGIRNSNELFIALQHFHVSLNPIELEFLYESYKTSGESNLFDFRSFASALYPKDEEPQSVLIAKDGLSERRDRLAAKQSNSSACESTTAMDSASSSSAAAVVDHHDDYVVVEHSDAPNSEVAQQGQSTAAVSFTQKQKNSTNSSNGGKKSKRSTMNGNTGRLTFMNRQPVLSSSLRHPTVKKYVEIIPSPYPSQEFMSHGKFSSTAVNPRFSARKIVN